MLSKNTTMLLSCNLPSVVNFCIPKEKGLIYSRRSPHSSLPYILHVDGSTVPHNKHTKYIIQVLPRTELKKFINLIDVKVESILLPLDT